MPLPDVGALSPTTCRAPWGHLRPLRMCEGRGPYAHAHRRDGHMGCFRLCLHARGFGQERCARPSVVAGRPSHVHHPLCCFQPRRRAQVQLDRTRRLRRHRHCRHRRAAWRHLVPAAGYHRPHGCRGHSLDGLHQPLRPALLCAALRLPHVRGALLLARVHVRLRTGRRAESAPARGADSPARHPPVRAHPRLSLCHRHHLARALPQFHPRRRGRLGLCHLHEPGVEHDVLVLPVPALRAQGAPGDGALDAPHPLAALLEARRALLDDPSAVDGSSSPPPR